MPLLDRYIYEVYGFSVIKSFGDSETEKIYDEKQSKKIPPDIQKRALTKN